MFQTWTDLLGGAHANLYGDASFWRTDDHFYHAQGFAHVMYYLTQALRLEYASELRERATVLELLDQVEDSLGKALFNIQGVGNVFVMENFVTVTKDESEGWNLLRDRVWKTIDKHACIYKVVDRRGLENIDVENFPSLSKEDQLKAVEMVLNRSIRSNLAKDGGGVEVKGIEANVVSIQYHGACGSCSTSSTGTLKYIQGQLKQQLHPNIEVKSI